MTRIPVEAPEVAGTLSYFEDMAARTQTSPTIERVRRIVFYFAPLVFFAIGIWGMWPFIEPEHRRMEEWRIPMFWMSEATSLFWYLVYGLGLLKGKSRPRGISWLVWLSLAAGFGVDVVVTVAERQSEFDAFARSVVARAGQANGATFGRHRGVRQLWHLECEFTDQQGANHVAIFDRTNTQYPKEIEQAALLGQFPIQLQVRYDPEWPRRNWLDATIDPHANRLYIWGLIINFLGWLLGVALVVERERTGFLPAEIAPFLAASFLMGTVGALRLLLAPFS